MAANPGPGLIDLYVYYRVRADDAQVHLDTAGAWLAALQEGAGVRGRLSRRPEAKDGLHTWMTSFLDVNPQQEADLVRQLADPGLGHRVQGERHLERFERLA